MHCQTPWTRLLGHQDMVFGLRRAHKANIAGPLLICADKEHVHRPARIA